MSRMRNNLFQSLWASKAVWRGALASLATACLVAGVVVANDAKPETPNEKPEWVKSDSLGGENRYLYHVSTDKPIYREGESVFVRGVLLEAHSRKPLTEFETDSRFGRYGNIEIISPKGSIIASGNGSIENSTLGFQWDIPEGTPGGEYTAKVTSPQLGTPIAERKFEIRAYRAPRLKSQIQFIRKGYGPGDTVSASLDVKRAEGGVPEDAKVTIIARVDGKEVHRSDSKVNNEGLAFANFDLPKEIERGEGTLSFVIEDGGVVETASKTIPILLQTVDLQLFPEGGDLVAGLRNRIYFEAKTPYGKPADLEGEIVRTDVPGAPAVVGKFRSEHEGRGRFLVEPVTGGKYAMRITSPAGINRLFDLPDAKEEGVVIRSVGEVYEAGKAVSVKVEANYTGKAEIILARQEKRIASSDIDMTKGQEYNLMFIVPDDASGVLSVTALTKKGMPLAERLIYRKPARQINIEIDADKPRYVPGGQAQITVKTTDKDGKPISAIVGLSVTDDSVLEMIDKREQAPNLPVMVLLESEVKDLADAHVYLDSNNPQAPLATDLLLGTQGWRRFAFVTPGKFIDGHGEDARRVLAMRTVTEKELKETGKLRFKMMRRGFEVDAMMVPAEAQGGAAEKFDDAPMDDGNADKPMNGVNAPDEKLGQQKGQGEADNKNPEPAVDEAQKNDELKDRLNRKQKEEAQGIAADMDARFAQEIAFTPYRVIREYSHQVREDRQPNERTDFTETLYWHAGIKTDPKTGLATVQFGLSDAVTSFRIKADAFDSRGALGAHDKAIESVEPFYAEPKMPLEVTMGDTVLLPLALVNGTEEPLPGIKLELTPGQGITLGEFDKELSLTANQRGRTLVPVTIGEFVGQSSLTIAATAGAYKDNVTRTTKIAPKGFPRKLATGGMLDSDNSLTFEIEIPESYVKGSVETQIDVYPTPLANLTGALEALIREPYGCFEQTSSSTYPLVMAQQYFTTHQGVDPDIVARSNEMIEKGYDRLLGFECEQGGYEWFGADPGHEALTAYGILEFTDMSQVFPVDQAMLDRTRGWLMTKRDGSGDFTRERRALHTWIEDKDCSNGYILWSLLSAGEPAYSLKVEIDHFLESAHASQNSYVLALAANVALLADRAEVASKFMDKLADRQEDDGQVAGGTTTIVGSGGVALKIETTAMTTLAWLKDKKYAGNVQKAVEFLASSCEGGRYGSTQSTVLALKAIVENDKARSKPKASGELMLMVDDNLVETLTFNEETHGTLSLGSIADQLKPGKHTIVLKMKDGAEMPASMEFRYNALTPASSKECKVDLNVELASTSVTEGEVTEAKVMVVNKTGEAIPTPVAIIGLPGGLEVRHDKLKELVDAGTIAAYEVIGRDVVLYWRSLKANQRVDLQLDLTAAIPGKYTGAASRAYLYYTDEYKVWQKGLAVEIAPRPTE